MFEEVYDLEIEEHVNRVLFALSQQSHKSGEGVIEKARVFERITRAFAPWKNGPSVKEYAKKIKRLK